MPTSKTLGAAGDSPDYTSLASFLGAITADDTDYWIGTAISSSWNMGSGVPSVSNANNQPHTVTSNASTHYNAQSGWTTGGHSSVEDLGAHASTGGATVIRVITSDFHFEWFQVQVGGNFHSGIWNDTNGTNTTCLGINVYCTTANSPDQGFYSNGGSATTMHCYYCNVYGSSFTSGFRARGSSVMNAYHCATLSIGTYGFYAQTPGGTINAYNCAAISSGTQDYIATGSGSLGGGAYNVSSDTSAPGASAYKSVSSFFANETAGSEDLHLASGNDGSYEGSDETATAGSVDQDGDTQADHDCGCDTIVGGGGGGVVFPYNLALTGVGR